jgi:hypothetical protein
MKNLIFDVPIIMPGIQSASQNLRRTLSGTGCTAIFRGKADENEGFRVLCFRKPVFQNHKDVGFGTHS